MQVPNNANEYLPGVIQTPSALEITNISRSYPMVVSTTNIPQTQVNIYIPQQLVKLFVPINFGMFQANGLILQILDVNGNDLSLDIDSTQFDSFVIPSTGEQPASLSPSGSQNLQYNNTTNNVPFKSLNNIGN